MQFYAGIQKVAGLVAINALVPSSRQSYGIKDSDHFEVAVVDFVKN